jgi:diguanylate cyclase (GGDEF)-like protein
MDEFQILLALHAPLPGRDLAAQLRARGFSVEVSRNQADTWAALRDRPPHAVLLAPVRQSGDSTELLSLLSLRAAEDSHPALVVLTDRPDFLDERAGEIDDFLGPDDPAEHIARRLVYAIARQTVRRRLADEKQRLLRASSTDFKTGLANDRQFSETCRIECARAIRENHWLGVLMIDLDDFKAINDQHDHDFGDHVLRQLAETLRESLRPFDTPARKGGDEFAVLLPSADLETACTIAERLRSTFSELEIVHEGHHAHASITIGVAAWHPESEETIGQVLRNADRALLAAKDSGRNRVLAHRDPEDGDRKAAVEGTATDEPAPTVPSRTSPPGKPPARKRATKKAPKAGRKTKQQGD